ncbi:ABC transporter substrate-binding protein [Salinarimonas soli]|uniref:ABC transporter substrate-binding protein n=1 Tax=Salinarimonas soli TaxID=1638099 RepID=A0A5B2VA47_9HYPH|nr:ABC transporter substrate-binding protein [Salinarimonas soli]KAA2235219.1 ABC transporter substrate-binding protein [Salinarimonas soli]
MITRRTALTGAAALGASLSMPTLIRAQAREPLTVMTPFGYISDFIEMMNAVSGGHFAAQGFDAKLLGGQGTAQALQQLIAGQVAFVRSAAIDQLRAVATTNAPLVSFSTLYQGSTFHVVSLKDKPITRAEDFKGKTVGLVSVGGTTDTFLDLMLQKVGLKKDDVWREVTGNSPGALQVLKQGRVDCFMCAINVVVTLQQMKEPIEVWSTDRYAPMPSQCYLTTQAMIDTKPEVMQRITRAMKASVDEMMTKPVKEIFQRAAKDFDIPGIRDLDTLVMVADAARERLWLSEGKENLMRNVPRLWTAGAEALRASGVADVKNVEALYTNRFIDAAKPA